MLTDFQIRKMNAAFRLIDVDQNGFIEKADFDQILLNLTEKTSLERDSDRYRDLEAKYDQIWSGMVALADENADNRISPDEWLRYIDFLFDNDFAYEAIVKYLVDEFFELFDPEGTDQISKEHFMAGASCGHMSPEDAAEAFRRLDYDQIGYLTRDDAHLLVSDFCFTSDPEMPGNWLCGPH